MSLDKKAKQVHNATMLNETSYAANREKSLLKATTRQVGVTGTSRKRIAALNSKTVGTWNGEALGMTGRERIYPARKRGECVNPNALKVARRRYEPSTVPSAD